MPEKLWSRKFLVVVTAGGRTNAGEDKEPRATIIFFSLKHNSIDNLL